jgi:hypothetical protein
MRRSGLPKISRLRALQSRCSEHSQSRALRRATDDAVQQRTLTSVRSGMQGGYWMRNSLDMRNSLVAAASIAAMLMLGASADKTAAMMGASPAQLGLVTADNNLVQKAALVCGRWGCRRVWRGSRVVWGARRVWWRRRVAWETRRAWWGPRPLFAYAGPSPALGWSSPGWGWSNPGWAYSSPAWGWSGGWGRGRPWGWNRW